VGNQHEWCSVSNKKNEIWTQAFLKLKELDWWAKTWWWIMIKIKRGKWTWSKTVNENTWKEVKRIGKRER